MIMPQSCENCGLETSCLVSSGYGRMCVKCSIEAHEKRKTLQSRLNSFLYILQDDQPVPVETLQWAQWFETHERTVKYDTLEVNGETVRVSTVFLGIDKGLGDGLPILWETMIFGGPLDLEVFGTYSSKQQALDGHEQAIKAARGEG